MALMCLATHAGEVPSAGNVVGNQTGTFNKTGAANDVLTVRNNDTNEATHILISFFTIVISPYLLLIINKSDIFKHM
jgi:hypothetical protein